MNSLVKIKRSNKICQALSLPVLANINPRSLYNKLDEFHEFVENESVDILFLSESWERENFLLNEFLNLQDYDVISNVYQRKERGGRPALIVNTKKYNVQD